MEEILDTQILQPTAGNIVRCAAALKAGGLVAFPTETVYALGAVATDAKAVEKVFSVKDRPLGKPLIVAVAKKSDIGKVAANIPEKAQALIDKFMPGALTVLFDRADCIPDVVTAGGDTVAVRIPDNKIALQLIELTGRPVVVPSANTADKPSPTLASHVKDDLDGKIEYILDGGASEIGIESTIIDVRTEPPTVLRVGGVSVDDIAAVIGEVAFRRENVAFSSNYTPNADVLFSAYYANMSDNICERYDSIVASGRKAVIICLKKNRKKYGDRKLYIAGSQYEDYAHNLFALLRQADSEHFDAVIAEGVKPVGIGKSLISRLVKVSGGNII
ncbi:MAG: threonylcarbamoyl-AMP synthase [Clostridiales bacterium]|nr:threonylcarbamoyl-AMP synthase [Clostridiales bacterium]